ncbi:MAG: hypothetical protein H7244_07945 [Herminiimonas sp.]|nr:hypothetical protein [Herminiimonas sp.]
MTTVCLLNGVDCQKPYGVDTQLVDRDIGLRGAHRGISLVKWLGHEKYMDRAAWLTGLAAAAAKTVQMTLAARVVRLRAVTNIPPVYGSEQMMSAIRSTLDA